MGAISNEISKDKQKEGATAGARSKLDSLLSNVPFSYSVAGGALLALTTYFIVSNWQLRAALEATQDRLQQQTALLEHIKDDTARTCAASQRGHLGELTSEITVFNIIVMVQRLVAGLLALAMVFGPAFLTISIDCLPQFIIGSSKVPMSQRLAYRLDTWFSTTVYSKPLALLMLTVWLVLAGSLGLFATSGQPLEELVWSSLAGVGLDWTFVSDEDGLMTRLVALMTSLGGLIVTALMLGIVSDFLSSKMDEIREGKSRVLEKNHTLILGWSDKVLPLVAQISNANESEGGGTIVILSELPKEEMERSVQEYDYKAYGTQVVCRSGSTLLVDNLQKVSVADAKSIVVLASEDDPDMADALTLRVVLSLAGIKEKYGLSGHIVAEVLDADNKALVQLVGGDSIETMVSADIIGRLMVQCGMQPGLAAIFDDLLGFEGCEFYMKEWKELTGRTFFDAMLMFERAVVLGVRTNVEAQGVVTRKSILNPKRDYVIQEGDEIIVIAEDDDKYKVADDLLVPKPNDESFQRNPLPPQPMNVLFLGWRRDLEDMISCLDSFACKGSKLCVVCELPLEERKKRLEARQGHFQTNNLELEHIVGDPVHPRVLKSLELQDYNFVIILAREDKEDIAAADSSTLATLLQLHSVSQKKPRRGSAIVPMENQTNLAHRLKRSKAVVPQLFETTNCKLVVAEILDSRTRHLLVETGLCAYVLSNEIISKTLSMVSENRDVHVILKELFEADGNELYIRPCEQYLTAGEELSFAELTARCKLYNDILIGYQLQDAENHELNPENKTQKRVWRKGDLVITLSEYLPV